MENRCYPKKGGLMLDRALMAKMIRSYRRIICREAMMMTLGIVAWNGEFLRNMTHQLNVTRRMARLTTKGGENENAA
jgi:hypothetical protein